jgi:metal-responsive CopG/Arc/MetJ family transcriptional regulator
MKTAISIPDEVFNEAELFAKNYGISRSQLFTQAVQHFVSFKKKNSITQKLNEVYANQDESLEKQMNQMQFMSIEKEEW